jgi:hypothetical protein
MADFVFLFRSSAAQANDAMGTPERAQQSMQAWLAWLRELETKGHLKHPGHPLERTGKLVSGKQRVVTDGPFAEAKDLVLGFMVIEARDIEHAVELSGACPIVVGGGAVEIRPVMDMKF